MRRPRFAAVFAALPAAVMLTIPQSAVTHADTLPPVTIQDNIIAATFTVSYPLLAVPGNPVHIRPGDTVVWDNLDPISHDVTFYAPACAGCQPFYAHMNPTQTATLTFQQAGYFEFVCQEHPNLPGMHGLFWVDPAAPI